MLGGIVKDGGETREYRMFLLPREDYVIIDNWHVLGLRGTGSKDLAAQDSIRPRTAHASRSRPPGAARITPAPSPIPAPLFRIPIFATFPYMLTGIALGIAQGAYEGFVDGLRGRVARYSGKSLADMTAVQLRVAEAAACIDTARRVMRDHCVAAQTLADRGEVPDLLTKATWRRDGAFSAGLCERAVDVLFKAGRRRRSVRRPSAATCISRYARRDRAHFDDLGAASDDLRPRRPRTAQR